MNTDNSGKEETDNDIIEFLLGSGTYQGKWFGEYSHPTFWWRTHLRKYIDTLKAENERLKVANAVMKKLRDEDYKLKEERDALLEMCWYVNDHVLFREKLQTLLSKYQHHDQRSNKKTD